METAVRELVKALLKTLYTEGYLTKEAWEKARTEADRIPIRSLREGTAAGGVDDL